MDADPFDLARFVSAQRAGRSIDHARRELQAGRKVTHWMWFTFPQWTGLGSSEMAGRYAIHSLDEARAYLAHPVLGPRLRELTLYTASHRDLTARDIFGPVDALKFKSSMTLFAAAASHPEPFASALSQFFDGPCVATLAALVRA